MKKAALLSGPVWIVYLASVWTLVDYPYGFWLFVFGAATRWALERL